MSLRLRKFFTAKKTTMMILSVVFFFVSSNIDIVAQKKFNKTFPASKNVRLQLTNREGTVTVEGWNKESVQVSAYLEAPAANIIPQNLSGTIVINVVKDNQGKDVGSVNFNVKVPYSSSVNIETIMGNLSVSNISGGLVRAHISSDGDITLTNISANSVSAENGIGDIFFDGEIKNGGIYRFTSTRGNINLRIPFDTSSFRLTATAPSTRNISLGALGNSGFRFVSEGRRVVGQLGDGSATVNITNQRGNIAFIRR